MIEDEADDTIFVRPLESRDEPEVLELIWTIYDKRVWKQILNQKSKKHIAEFYVLCAILAWMSPAATLSLKFCVFVGPTVVLYLLAGYLVNVLQFRKCPESVRGVYGFWSRRELGYRFWVAELDGAVVGTVGVERVSATSGAIWRLTVREDHRGRGVGRALLGAAVDSCTKHGLDNVVLKAQKGHPVAWKLCREQGFEHVDMEKRGGPIFGYRLNVYRLGLTGKSPAAWNPPRRLSRFHNSRSSLKFGGWIGPESELTE